MLVLLRFGGRAGAKTPESDSREEFIREYDFIIRSTSLISVLTERGLKWGFGWSFTEFLGLDMRVFIHSGLGELEFLKGGGRGVEFWSKCLGALGYLK